VALQTKEIGDVFVVTPAVLLRDDVATAEVDAELRRQLECGRKKLLLDLLHTSYLSSVAIGVLAGLHTSATSRGAHFGVCNLERRIRNLLTIVRLIDVLNVYDSLDDALERFERM
jgi:anti-anti-sigma factor